MTPSSWTPERTEKALGLWKQGFSAGEISKLLGGLTRNAVIGKLNRIGAPSRSGTARNVAARVNGPKNVDNVWTAQVIREMTRLYLDEGYSTVAIGAQLGITRQAVASKLTRLGVRLERINRPRIRPDRPVSTAPRPRLVVADPWAAIGPTVSLMELHSHSCRWPIGDDYCGAQKTRGSYCSHHAAIGYTGIPVMKPKRPHGMERRG